MRKDLLKGVLGLAAAALLVPQPADAAMSCWNRDQAAAAKIRNLQSQLMVATMRCKAMGIDVLTDYNDFVRVNRSTLQAANGVIKAQFADGFGAEEAQTFYDRFTTALANAYGADPTDGAICEETALAAREAVAANGDIPLLLELAERLGRPLELPGGECPISFTALE